jgi:hypothetical protein
MRFEARRVALVVLGALAALLWVKVAMVLVNPPTVPPTLGARGAVWAERDVVWADRVFVNRRGLAVWLRSRGASYDEWLKNHPSLTPATSARAPVRHAHNAPAQGQPTVVGSNSWLSRLGWLALALVLTAGLVAAVARSVLRVSYEPAEEGEAPILDELWEAAPAQRVHVRSSASSG